MAKQFMSRIYTSEFVICRIMFLIQQRFAEQCARFAYGTPSFWGLYNVLHCYADIFISPIRIFAVTHAVNNIVKS